MIKIFFSYSHKDEGLRDELEKHLSILKRTGVIEAWHDRCIDSGRDLKSEISNNLLNSDIILLLVSSDFLASDYCYDVELQEAMKLHRAQKAIVMPVILKPCDWQSALFGGLLACPTDGKPVIKFALIDDAYLEITKAIKNNIASINKKGSLAVRKIEPAIERNNSLPRSSNLRVIKPFTDLDKDHFLHDAFEYIANFFEGSLEEMKNRHSDVDFVFKRVDTDTFSCSIYREGKAKSTCMIFLGSMMGRSKTISYSTSISASKNSFNESLFVVDNGNLLALKPIGMMTLRSESDLSNEGAAEHFWATFIRPLQQ